MSTPGLLIAVFGLALVDSVNPSALVVTTYLLSGRSPTRTVLAYVTGVFTSYLAIGVGLMLGLDVLLTFAGGEVLDSTLVYVVQGVAGGILLCYAIIAPDEAGPDSGSRVPETRSTVKLFALGVIVTVIEFSTALPYLGAIALLTEANLQPSQWLPILVGYNLVFVLPPVVLLGAFVMVGNRTEQRFDGLRARLQRHSRTTFLTVIGIVGFLLLADSLAYFGYLSVDIRGSLGR